MLDTGSFLKRSDSLPARRHYARQMVAVGQLLSEYVHAAEGAREEVRKRIVEKATSLLESIQSKEIPGKSHLQRRP